MTNDEREALIEKARVAYVEAWEREDAYLTLNNHPKTGHQRSRAGIIAALGVFEQAHTPTDDERELVEEMRRCARDSASGTHTSNSPLLRGADLATRVADALERRRTQAEPTDAMLLTALNARDGVIRDLAGFPRIRPAETLLAFGEESILEMRAALRAAFQEGENR